MIGQELHSDQIGLAPLSAEMLINVARLFVPLDSQIPIAVYA
jgi:hypothetical protein